MRGRDDAGDPPHHWRRPRPVPISAVADLPFAGDGLSRVSRFPVGHLVVGNRLPGDLPGPFATVAPTILRRAALAAGALVAAVAAVQIDVPVRLRETAQPRSDLAQPDGAHLPLRNSAAADVDRLVCASVAGVGAEGFRRHDVRHRAARPVPDLRAAAAASLGVPGFGRLPGADLPHRQLLLLQPADGRPVPAAAR